MSPTSLRTTCCIVGGGPADTAVDDEVVLEDLQITQSTVRLSAPPPASAAAPEQDADSDADSAADSDRNADAAVQDPHPPQ